MRALITQETAKFVLFLLELQRSNLCLDVATEDKTIQDHVYNLDQSIRELKNAIETAETTIDIVLWDEADLEGVLEEKGIESNEKNIQAFKDHGSGWFHESQIGQVWDILDTVVEDMKRDGYFESDTPKE